MLTVVLNTEKQETQNRIETQNNGSQNATHIDTIEQTLIQEDEIDVEVIKKIRSKRRLHYHRSRTKTGKSQGRNWKDKLLTNIPKEITELNELIYAGAKLVSDKIGVPLRNTNGSSKPG